MLRQDATFLRRLPEPPADEVLARFRVLGSVGFIGRTAGILHLCLTEEFTRWATGELLGLKPADVDRIGPAPLRDAMGEITNMTAGGFKNVLADTGYPCKLSLPTIVCGQQVGVAAITGTARFIYEFDCASHRLIADIQIKTD